MTWTAHAGDDVALASATISQAATAVKPAALNRAEVLATQGAGRGSAGARTMTLAGSEVPASIAPCVCVCVCVCMYVCMHACMNE